VSTGTPGWAPGQAPGQAGVRGKLQNWGRDAAMPNEEQIKAWKEQHGDVFEIRGEDAGDQEMTFYFRKPGRADLSRFAKEATKDVLLATNNLVVNCLLHPGPDVLRKLIDDKPGIVLALGAELQKLIGSNQDFFSRKL